MSFPVDAIVPQLNAALSSGRAALLVAEPGAGKTTRVPLLLLDQPWLDGRKIVMLEPRRLAARAAARRMAETLGEDVGGTVGYAVRLDRKISARTRIEVVTEGILTRRLQTDPELSGVGLVIFDEFHERSLDGDFGLALTLDIQRGLRDDLRILVMSATLDAARVAAHLGDAPVIDAPGRVFPVETRYLERAQRQTIAADAARAVHHALSETGKSLLVFLPGEAEIRRTERALDASVLPEGTTVHPLFGAMGFAAQEAAIRPAQGGAGDHDRRDQPHHRWHRRGDRHRLQARSALRSSLRHDGTRNHPRVAGFRRPAPRPGREAWTGRLLPSLARGRDARTGAA